MPGRAAIGSPTLFTAGELAAVPNPDLPRDIWQGVLRVVMTASAAHGWAVSRLTVMLGQFVYAHDLGELFSESTGFLLQRGPDTLLCPDVAFVAKGRLPAGALGSPFLEVAPDLAVEILSAGDRPAAVGAKVAEYFRLGVRCVWAFDPAAHRVQVHARDAAPGRPIATS